MSVMIGAWVLYVLYCWKMLEMQIMDVIVLAEQSIVSIDASEHPRFTDDHCTV
jgi:hypothetical protein